MTSYVKDDGYMAVTLSKEGKRYSKYIHRLVAEVYIHNDDPETKIMVNHIDSNKTNNNFNNLCWVKQSINADYVTYYEKVNRKYGTKVNNEILDDFIALIMSHCTTVTEAAHSLGYTIGYMSTVLRRRVKERDILDLWESKVRTGRNARTS